jgi:polysaccharide biosynthesis/export protein
MLVKSWLVTSCSTLCKLSLPVLCLALPLPGLAQLAQTEALTLPFETTPSSISGYRLGPGDQIEIAVFGYEEYTGAKTILSDGTITLPLLGVVPAADRTPEQLAQDLTARLQVYLVDPVVTVSLNTLRPVVVNVAGEVQRPGPVKLRAVTATAGGGNTVLEGAPTVSSALMQAGGITQNADIRQVVVRRSLPNGESSTSALNLWEGLLSENAPEDLVLQDGDAIFVPRLTGDATIDRRLIARSSLSPGTVRVRVVGEVKSPGEIQVPPDSSLSSAVAIAGGPTEDARLSRVAFVRMSETGQIQRETINLENLTDGYQVRRAM